MLAHGSGMFLAVVNSCALVATEKLESRRYLVCISVGGGRTSVGVSASASWKGVPIFLRRRVIRNSLFCPYIYAGSRWRQLPCGQRLRVEQAREHALRRDTQRRGLQLQRHPHRLHGRKELIARAYVRTYLPCDLLQLLFFALFFVLFISVVFFCSHSRGIGASACPVTTVDPALRCGDEVMC